jgi:tRNA pseudouridine55 synthase
MNGRVDGVLVIDKPAGPTSHDVVARVRRALGERRVGHTGTLDPGATGVLPLVVGRATRLARFLADGEKTYECTIRLGFSTDTGDAGGRPTSEPWQGALPDRFAIDRTLDAFRGSFLQQPPAFSAKKIDGTRSHRIARRAVRTAAAITPPAPVQVTAHAIDLVILEREMITVHVVCSPGFYVRSLAHDLGGRLGVGAHISSLRRTRSGEFTLAQAVSLDTVERNLPAGEAALIPLGGVLPGLASVGLTHAGVQRAAHGRDLGPEDLLREPGPIKRLTVGEPLVRLLDERGDLVGIARTRPDSGALHPFVVLV